MTPSPSSQMRLSPAERGWLPWTGTTGKLAMGWACWLNRSAQPHLEQTFEGIAQARVKRLQQWAQGYWEHLAELAENLAEGFPALFRDALSAKLKQLPDCAQLFVLDSEGRLLGSTWEHPGGQSAPNAAALAEGLRQPFLHGPYRDPLTEQIGPTTSGFHDAVTLMFYQPIRVAGQARGCLCARVPNDVLGDLIQREAGHVFAESGDNYLFMVESVFAPNIAPGTALSRSRFEDATFSLGENLKAGVHTAWGTVRVHRHTELELRFTDPATGQLHPGVRETIARGSNLFVGYPGYSDYRHVPVVGKGLSFRLPGSPDRWGMMCEADLEEVYRRRSLSVGLMKTYLATVLALFLLRSTLQHFSGLPPLALDALDAVLLALGAICFATFGPNRLAVRMQEMTGLIRTLAEGEGNLRQRLDTTRMGHDETGDMARWINSFIDSLDGIVGQVIQVSAQVRQDNEMMLARSGEAGQTTREVSGTVHDLLLLVEEQLGQIQQASMTAEQMQRAMDEVVARAGERLETVRQGTQSIRDVVKQSASSVQQLDSRMAEIGKCVGLIGEITSQTNLLALNAAIEAARAGEHGRGFAVVAGEVRTLAQRTAQTAEQIGRMVGGLQDETRRAVAFMDEGVQSVDNRLTLTETASAENAQLHAAVQRIFEIIRQLNERSLQYGQTIRGVEHASADMGATLAVLGGSAERVRHTARKLQQLVGQFRVSGQVR